MVALKIMDRRVKVGRSPNPATLPDWRSSGVARARPGVPDGAGAGSVATEPRSGAEAEG